MKAILCLLALAVCAAPARSARSSVPLFAQSGAGAREDTLTVTPEQVAAVDRGLAWLAKHQAADGSWVARVGFKVNNSYRFTSEDKGHLGVTALACMAFLAGGHLPGRGEYGPVVERGLAFVLSCVQDDGYATRHGSRMYDHAFATLFLAEIYGMTHREDVKTKLQLAVDYVVTSQNAEGGWRYEPHSTTSDMSIVVCQVIALRAARNIGIRVPKATVDRAARYVVDSAVTEREDLPSAFGIGNEVGTFLYQRDVYSRSSFPLTAAGVTALHGLGIYSDEAIRKGLDYLASNLSQFDSNSDNRRQGHYFFWYGHYYAVQAMYTAGSPYWEPYFEEVRRVLIDMQRPDGSWPNDVGPGAAFGTACAALILEIPYRFLPIFQR
ncbi:MAG: prenyltransferase/squalene oxidase repeat-containing protein [Planctomycetota bacterium]